MISLHGKHISYLSTGSTIGPVLEVTVDSVEAAKGRLLAKGCTDGEGRPDIPAAIFAIHTGYL